ncbi:MAG: hypothetical protein ACYCTV_05455 [Leptospirales bacterium]
MSVPDRQELDSLLERILLSLDPDDLGETQMDRVLETDWHPLNDLLSHPPEEGRSRLEDQIALSHKLERLRKLIEPFVTPQGPLSLELVRVSRLNSNPYLSRGRGSFPSELNRTV